VNAGVRSDEKRMRAALANIALGAGLLIPPVAAELYTAKPNNVPGTGFDVLLYQPFQFAYALLGLVLFVVLNIALRNPSPKRFWAGTFAGTAIALCWFFLAFLTVGQVHISLGGKL
jgi:hypothetical protein